MEFGLKAIPQDVPREVVLDVQQAIEEVLGSATPSDPQSLLQRLVLAAVERSLGPWKRQQEIERIVQEARKQLPFNLQTYSDWFPPTEWEFRAMSAARDAIARIVLGAPLTEVRAAAVQAGKQVAMEYEEEQAEEQARVRAEQERQRLQSMKSLLVSVGVAHTGRYLSKLHTNNEIWDEDLERKSDLENRVREALEERLKGTEGFEGAERIAHEVVDHELE
jgi:hypothetical protein